MKKRILSILMSLCMLVMLLPVTAGAVDETFDVGGITYKVTSDTDNTVEVTEKSGETYSGAITIPASVSSNETEYTVVGIGLKAFEESSVTEVTLSEGIQYIKTAAFLGCTELESLKLPSTLSKIDTGAFGGCSELTSLEIPAAVEDGIIAALTGVTGLSSYTDGCYPNIQNVTFAEGSPYTLEENGAIYKDTTLVYFIDPTATSLTVKAGTTEIGENALNFHSELDYKLSKITFADNSLVTVGRYAFANSAITEIDFPESVKAIEAYAFYQSSIEKIDLSGVTSIETAAFNRCADLAEVTWPENLSTMGEKAFLNCSSLTNVEIKGDIEEIPKEAFYHCSGLKTVSLPEGLSTIGNSAFAITASGGGGTPALEYINIPSSVTSLGSKFVTNLADNGVIVSAVADPSIFTNNAISGIKKGTFIYPAEYAEKYQANDALKTAGLVKEPTEDDPAPTYSLTIEETKSIEVGKTTTLTVTATVPTDATLEWNSSNDTIATVENGTVTGVAAGSATVTASIKLNGITLVSDTCAVTVTAAQQPETPVEPSVPSTPSYSDDNDDGYSVSVPASSSIRGGSITVSPRGAEKGDEVTITLKPDQGYELSELTVTDGRGDELKLSWESDNRCTFTMPSSRVDIQVSFRPIETAPVNPFVDVNTGDYYYDAVLWALDNGVTSGTSAVTFSPNAVCTRAQMMTYLWRAAGSPRTSAAVNPFADVDTGDYYYDAVLWAVEKGITGGTSATTFSPDAPVTRGQSVTFLWRAAGSPAASGPSFGDVAAEAYYADAVAWAVDQGITAGTGGNTFSPDQGCTRAQTVTYLYARYGA